jgi:cell pole-organizing protein PopZ
VNQANNNLAQVDVLAVMERSSNMAVSHAREFPASATLTRHADECREALSAVAELVAACKERDEAEGEYSVAAAMYGEESNCEEMRSVRRRSRKAVVRYAAAMRPFNGSDKA